MEKDGFVVNVFVGIYLQEIVVFEEIVGSVFCFDVMGELSDGLKEYYKSWNYRNLGEVIKCGYTVEDG